MRRRRRRHLMSAPVPHPTRPVRSLVAAATLAAVVLLAGCGSNGRELREPERDVTSPTRSVPSTVPPISLPTVSGGTGSSVATFPPVAPGVFDLASSAFVPGTDLPDTFTCGGPSPALRWQGIPEGTAELALVVESPGDRGDVHWIVTGIPPTDGSVDQGAVPVGAVQHTNSLGGITWYGPCPPPGEAYPLNFSLLALAQPAVIPAGTPVTDSARLLTEQANGKVALLTSSVSR
jgi:phosphatidylethanolamine-binding protein (PEBP) family uncharacterized protein